MAEWRYLLQRIAGPDAGKIVHHDLPLKSVTLERVLSGPGVLEGRIEVADAVGLVDENGQLLIDEWGTAIWAEASGQIRGGGIVVSAPLAGDRLDISCMGYSGYAKDTPYDGIYYGVQVDPLAMVRLIWDHIQAQPDSNIGLVVDPTISPVRIGTEIELVEFTTGLGETVAFEAGPFKLAWWVTDDLGGEIDSLAADTPFEYLEHDSWDAGGTQINHRLELGYPTIGRRRDDLRFAVGENILMRPEVTTPGEDFGNGAIVLGSGEGRDRVRSPLLYRPDGRLRRIAQVEDKSINRVDRATSVARETLDARGATPGIESVTVIDHPNAPLGSFDVGDEIPVDLYEGARPVSQWGRVVAMRISPENTGAMDLDLVRTDKVTG